MASVEFLNAAFDSAMQDVKGLVRLLPDIPFVDEQSVAMKELSSPQGRVMLLKLIKNAIAAGEAAEAAKDAIAAKEAEAETKA
jgi:hypothetical protein